MIITNSDIDLEDIFDVRDSLDTDNLESLLDSRLDVESVLIDDIKLETDLMVYCSDSQSSGGSGTYGDHQALATQHIKGRDRKTGQWTLSYIFFSFSGGRGRCECECEPQAERPM